MCARAHADRDFDCSSNDRYDINDFVEEKQMTKLRDFIARSEAKGGGDCAEDVAGGLKKALDLSWKGDTRIIIHIADAPAHGSEYNGGCGDDHPGPQDPDRTLPQDSNHGWLSAPRRHASPVHG